MKKLVVAAAILLVATPAMSINRYYSRDLTPNQINEILAQEGEIILWYPGKRNTLLDRYNRFVSHASGCGPGMGAQTVSVAAKQGAKISLISCVMLSGAGSTNQKSTASAPAAAAPAPAPAPIGDTDL